MIKLVDKEEIKPLIKNDLKRLSQNTARTSKVEMLINTLKMNIMKTIDENLKLFYTWVTDSP